MIDAYMSSKNIDFNRDIWNALDFSNFIILDSLKIRAQKFQHIFETIQGIFAKFNSSFMWLRYLFLTKIA